MMLSMRDMRSMPRIEGFPTIALEFIPEWSRFHDQSSQIPDPFTCWYETARGWPVASMNGRKEISRLGPPIKVVNEIDIRGRVLPLRPIAPGFAINTLFYGGILWLLFAAPFAIRRWRRVKRGLCPACGYPVGTSDVCTECGRSLNRAVEVHQ